MEENVWAVPEVYDLLKERFVIISLYVDDREELNPEEQFNYQYPDGRIKEINTIGKKMGYFSSDQFQYSFTTILYPNDSGWEITQHPHSVY